MGDLFKKAQGKCNCPGKGWGGYKCPYCGLTRKDRKKSKRHARRILKLILKIMQE
jgi:hypothetical protein